MKAIDLIRSIIASLKNAVNTERANTEAVAKLKAEHAAEMETLRQQLKEAKEDDAAIESLVSEMDEALTLAAAARPPLPEQIEAVQGVEPMKPGVVNPDAD